MCSKLLYDIHIRIMEVFCSCLFNEIDLEHTLSECSTQEWSFPEQLNRYRGRILQIHGATACGDQPGGTREWTQILNASRIG